MEWDHDAMRWTIIAAVIAMIGGSSCGGEATSRTVLPDTVEVSADRRVVTVVTAYPLGIDCAKEPTGLEVEVDGESVTVRARMANLSNPDGPCTLECGQVTQSVTLHDPLPSAAQFRFPDDADPGCMRGFDSTLTPAVIWHR